MDLSKRANVPDINEAARQVIDDMRSGDDATRFLDVVETVAAFELNEDDLVALVTELARRVAEYEAGADRANSEQEERAVNELEANRESTEVGAIGSRYVVRQSQRSTTLLRTDDFAEAEAEARRISAEANSPGKATIWDAEARVAWRYEEGEAVT